MESVAFARITRDFLVPLRARPTLLRVLDAAANPGISAQAMADVLEENPLYPHLLLKLDFLQKRISEWSAEEEMSRDKRRTISRRAHGLIGKAAVRNFVAAVSMCRITGSGLPRAESEAFKLQPRDWVKYALLAEEYCEEHHLPHIPNAYVGGLHYDQLLAVLNAHGAVSPEVKSTLTNDLWPESLKVARICHELAAFPSQFRFSEFAFGTGLAIGVGRLLMTALFPRGGPGAWADFMRETASLRAPGGAPGGAADAVAVLEKSRFPLTSRESSSLIFQFFGPFQSVERSVLHWSEPSFLKASDSDSFLLSLILAAGVKFAAQASANSGPSGSGAAQPAAGAAGLIARLSAFERLHLKSFKIGDKELESVAQRVLQLK